MNALDTLVEIVTDEAEHLTSQEYIDIMNELRCVHNARAVLLPPPPKEDPYNLLFLYIDKNTAPRRNPRFEQRAFASFVSKLMDKINAEPIRLLKAALFICLIQYIFQNANIFTVNPRFDQSVLQKLKEFNRTTQHLFEKLGRLEQLTGFYEQLSNYKHE